MEIDFETWKKFVKDAKITKVELKLPESLYIEFDNGMVSYVYSEKPLQFDFNWLNGYEFLSKKALNIYIRKMMKKFETERKKKTIKEKHGYPEQNERNT